MTVVATDTARLSNVLKYEFDPSGATCREVVTAYEASEKTYKPGTILGRFLSGGTAAAVAAAANTGDGAMGAITVGAAASKGIYTLKIVAAAANAGSFTVTGPNGEFVGLGTVAVAFSGGGLSFTLADGAADFVVGDTLAITVAGTEKYKILTATAVDGSADFAGMVIGDVMGDAGDFTVAATTDTTVLILARGPAKVAKESLDLDATVNTAAEKANLYAQMSAVGIHAVDQV